MSGESVLGELWIAIRANLKGLDKDLNQAKGNATKILGGLGKAAGGALVAGLALATGAAIGLGKAALDSAMTMDGAYDTIINKTGATGQALDGLKEDFKAVFKSVPTDAATASDALSVLYDRTGLTGQALQDMTKQLLNLSNLTGSDATMSAENFTRVLGDWSVSTEDAGGVMDMFYVAGQKAGVGVDDLMTKVVQFGSPLRLMGFSLKQAISMFAKWEKEGVNSELVMGSLRIAAGKFADEGKPLQESLQETIAQIKGNEDATAALSLGMEIFGARAGPDMVAAIREGRFSIDEFAASIENAEGSINATALATMDYPEKLTMVKNQITTALSPAGEAIMDLASKLIDKLQPALDRLGPFVRDTVAPAFERLGDAVLKIADGDVEGALATLFGGQAEQPGTSVTSAIEDLAGTIGGLFAAALKGVFGLPENVDDTASGLEQLLRDAVYQVGGVIPSLAMELVKGFASEFLISFSPKSMEDIKAAAEWAFPRETRPVGENAGVLAEVGLRVSSMIGDKKAEKVYRDSIIQTLAATYASASEAAKAGLIAGMARHIDTSTTDTIIQSLGNIDDPALKQKVISYLMQYTENEVLPRILTNLQMGEPALAAQASAALGPVGKDVGVQMASSLNTAFLAEMARLGVIGGALYEAEDEANAGGASLGIIAAQAMQGSFSAAFGGWQPPQLQIGANGMMPMTQSVPTPSALETIAITLNGGINIYSSDPKTSGRAVVEELLKYGAQQ